MAGPQRRPRGLGRPPRLIKAWVTEAEYQLIREAASRPGRGVTLARFVAEASVAAADPSSPPSVAVTGRRRAPSLLALAEIADAAVEVSRVGNNLNQLAREYNSTGRRPVGTVAEVERALTALRHLADIADAATDE